MSEEFTDNTPTRTCSVKLVQMSRSLKIGPPAARMEDVICPSDCPGLQSTPRKIGSLTLPHIFDEVYCGQEIQ